MEILDNINTWLWSGAVIPALIICALWFTVMLRGVQMRNWREMMRVVFGSTRKEGEGGISSFHAFVVSLASRVGTGNLAGVASAICIGGPGAVFWMWVMALVGAATGFVESTLAQLYKERVPGAYIGGPAYYMLHGLGRKWMGVLFAVLITITFGMANQLMQSNQICMAAADTFSLDIRMVGAVLTVFTVVIIIGGIHRIANFAAAVVPFMAIAYLCLAIYVVVSNIALLPQVARVIVESALGVHQAAGGMVGAAISQGIKRGLFSNEAGEGSAPNAAATAEVTHPIKQGLVQALGVFVDTLVICSCTAVIILLSGVSTATDGGILVTSRALEAELGAAGRYFVTVAIFFFAYSSIIGNYYYGETNVRFISGRKSVLYAFRAVTALMVMLGAMMTIAQVWSIIDLCMGTMTLVNLAAIIQLSPRVRKLWLNYREQRRAGQDPCFHRSDIPDIGGEIKCWE